MLAGWAQDGCRPMQGQYRNLVVGVGTQFGRAKPVPSRVANVRTRFSQLVVDALFAGTGFRQRAVARPWRAVRQCGLQHRRSSSGSLRREEGVISPALPKVRQWFKKPARPNKRAETIQVKVRRGLLAAGYGVVEEPLRASRHREIILNKVRLRLRHALQ